MAKRHYEENECVKALKRNPFININTVDKTIGYNPVGVGIHTFGKIDCLCNYHGYTAYKETISKKQVNVDKDENSIFINKKDIKKSLIKSVKNSINRDDM